MSSAYIPSFTEALDMSRSLGRRSDNPLAWHDLQGVWSMLQGGGDPVRDMTGRENAADFVAGVTWTAGGPPSVPRVLDFDGQTDWLDTGVSSNTSPLKMTGAMTLFGLASGHSSSSPVAGIIGSAGDSGERGPQLGVDNGDRGGFSIATSSTVAINAFGTGLSIGEEWNFWVGTFKPSTYIRSYLNGVQIGENTTSIPAAQYRNDTISIKVGHRGGGTGPAAYAWFGKIALAGIASRVWSDNEIQIASQDPSGMFRRRSLVFPAAVAAAAFTGRNQIIGGGILG